VTNAAMALMMAGDSAQATRISSEMGKKFPQNTAVQAIWLPQIRATGLALRRQGRRRAA
jgi:hypothetical protein